MLARRVAVVEGVPLALGLVQLHGLQLRAA
jgi:hypothetical protein